MTTSGSGSDRQAAAGQWPDEEQWPDDDIDAAEREEDAEDERQRVRSTLVGAVVVLLAVVLTVGGVVTVLVRVAELPDAPSAPGVVQQVPAAPQPSP